MQWQQLRPVQVKAIHHLLDGGGDCVVSVPTAGGKTEAAFLPIISSIADDSTTGVRAMYVGPLKALINDQFQRLEELCERMEIPVHKWHGDVSDGARRALFRQPGGILLITPESLEAMFVLRATRLPSILSRLSYVVIDELHAFIGSVRGAQLQSLLHRLQLRTGADPVRVGLSATLGEPGPALRWLRPGGPEATLLDDAEAKRRMQIRVRAFTRRAESTTDEEEDSDPDEDVLTEVARSMMVSIRGATNLVFANAKSRIEELADALVEQTKALNLPDEIVVHHGSLSVERRTYAEARLHDPRPCTAVCSNTLEMGIDIGHVDTVVQLSAPWSVASLTQRLGRSGRGDGDAARLRAFFIVDETDHNADLWKRLHLDFLQGIAIIELMRERFVEPPAHGRPHRSTLIQQLLSTLAETGGIRAAALHQRLSSCGAFGELPPAELGSILRELGRRELVEQMPAGDLILGHKAQRLIDHYSFYAAFDSSRELTVMWGPERIGTLPAETVPPAGEHVLLAGRRWRVLVVDGERGEVEVVPSPGKRPPAFVGLGGDIHLRVHQKMLALACGAEVPAYLDEVAVSVLGDIRATAAAHSHFQPALVAWGAGSRLFVWSGSKLQRTLYLALRGSDLAVEDCGVGLELKAPPAVVRAALQRFGATETDGAPLAMRAHRELAAQVVGADKYDAFLPEEVWRAAYVADRLDLPGARAAARRWTEARSQDEVGHHAAYGHTSMTPGKDQS